jgi:phosphohistidine phosphatase
MKRLVLVRHAKAVHFGYDNDFDRELQPRGISDAGRIGRKLKELKIIPDLMISSPAIRALTTASIFASETGYPVEKIEENDEIYEQYSPGEFLNFVRALPDKAEIVFVFGHNPGFHQYALYLLAKFNDEFPTCATIGIDFPVNTWCNVKARTGVKIFFLTPGNII